MLSCVAIVSKLVTLTLSIHFSHKSYLLRAGFINLPDDGIKNAACWSLL
jgi:hypothetical protein